MAIRKPTNLFLNFTADLQVDSGNGRTAQTALIGYTEQVPFSAYSNGSLELKNQDGEKGLGSLTVGVFVSTVPLDFRVEGSTNTITSKIFTYNGEETTVYVQNNNATVATLEYVFGAVL